MAGLPPHHGTQVEKRKGGVPKGVAVRCTRLVGGACQAAVPLRCIVIRALARNDSEILGLLVVSYAADRMAEVNIITMSGATASNTITKNG